MYRAQYRICVEGHSNAMSHHLELAGRIDSGGGPELSSEFEWSSFFLKTFLNQNFSMGGPYLHDSLCGPKSSPKFEWAKTFITLKSITWQF